MHITCSVTKKWHIIIKQKFHAPEAGILFNELQNFHCIIRFCHLDGAFSLHCIGAVW